MSRGAQVSADAKVCIIEINGQEVPAVGAAYIAVAGTISLKCGSKKEAGRQEKVDLKPGTEFSVGGMSFTVSKAGNAPRAFELPKSDEASDRNAARIRGGVADQAGLVGHRERHFPGRGRQGPRRQARRRSPRRPPAGAC